MTLIQLSSPQEVQRFLQQHPVALITFSAHWCGPCRASKPQLEALAKDAPIPCSIVYEDELGEYIHTFQIRAFPTYVVFLQGREVERVEGVNFGRIAEMISKHQGSRMPTTGGSTLGGGESIGQTAAVSPEEARRLRLAKLEASSAVAAATAVTAASSTTTATNPSSDTTTTTTAPTNDATKTPMELEGEEETPMDTADPAIKQHEEQQEQEQEQDNSQDIAEPHKSPVEDLDPQAIQTLTEQMGFALIRAQKGLLYSPLKTVESAVEWIMEHQEEDNVVALSL